MRREPHIVTEQEFELLKRIQNSSKLKPEDFSSKTDFDNACQMALELFQKGYLYTRKPSAYVPDDEPIVFDCLAARFHLTIKSINSVTDYANYGEYLQANPSSFSTTAFVYVIVALLTMTSLGTILMI